MAREMLQLVQGENLPAGMQGSLNPVLWGAGKECGCSSGKEADDSFDNTFLLALCLGLSLSKRGDGDTSSRHRAGW